VSRNAAIGLAVAFALGFVAGHFSGRSVFGYRTYQECVLAEAKDAGTNAYLMREIITRRCSKYPGE
jgi:hypothetical protein